MVWQSHYWIIGCSADFFSSKSEVTYVWLTPPVEREKSTQFLDTVLLFREPLDLQNSTFCTSLAARILKKRPVSFQDRDSKFRLKKSFGPKSICCPQRSDMAHHEKDVINAMSIVMTNLSWQGLQPRPLKEVAQAGLPFRMFVRYLCFFSEESPLDSLLTSKKWHSAAFFEQCQVGEADPEDKKAQCLLTRIQIQRFVFSSVEPGSWVFSHQPMTWSLLVETWRISKIWESHIMPSNGRVTNIIRSHISRWSMFQMIILHDLPQQICNIFTSFRISKVKNPRSNWCLSGELGSESRVIESSKALFGFSNRWGQKPFMTCRHDGWIFLPKAWLM